MNTKISMPASLPMFSGMQAHSFVNHKFATSREHLPVTMDAKSKDKTFGRDKRRPERRKILQDNFQYKFSSPIRSTPRVAILGGGMSGLLCALTLRLRGIHSTVFDTGIHGLGGRMGTREIEPNQLVFDHAAQFFTVSDPKFRVLVEEWLAKGIVKAWNGTVGTLRPGGEFSPFPAVTRYIGTKGMRHFADSLISEDNLINIVRPCWVSRMEPYDDMWHLYDKMKPCGDFDFVVIAHNGKCANRLRVSAGIPFVAKQMKRLELSSIWALLAAFDEPLPLPTHLEEISFEAAFVEGLSALSWMANNTKKLFPSRKHGPSCWTFFSTAAYGKRNKVPQESIPKVRAEKVKRDMLRAVEIALALPRGLLPTPTYTRVQLWGAALPTNTPSVPCIFDPHGRAGICGDWLLGSSLEAAALSGMALGHHIADFCASDGSNPEKFEIGLSKELTAIAGHDIGQFAGIKSSHEASSLAELALS